MGGGLPAALHEPERAGQARSSGHGCRRWCEDAVRRGVDKIEDQAGLNWLQRHLDYTTPASEQALDRRAERWRFCQAS